MTPRFIILLALLLAVCARAANVTVTASNLALASPWFYVIDANNTPEGSWSIDGSVHSGPEVVNVPLNQTLPSGNYSVFAKVLDLDHGNSFTYAIGGTTSGSQTLDDRDVATIYWSTNLPVHANSSFSSISFTFTFNGAFATQLRLIAFYITSDTNEIVLRDDRALPFSLVNVVDTTVVKGNLLPNSSFEGGISRFWRVISSPVAGSPPRTYTLQDCLETNDAVHGQQSVKIGTTTDSSVYMLESNPVLCHSNRIHSFSVWAKSSTGNSRVTLRVNSMYTAPVSGATPTFETNMSTTVDTSWTRVGLTNIFLPWYPNGQYYLVVETRQDAPGLGSVAFTSIDAVQLEEGGMTAYAPMYPFDAGPTLSERTQILHTNDAPTVKIRAYNDSNGSLTKQVAYTIYNWTNGIALAGSTNLVVSSSNFNSASIAVPVTQKGHFRMTTSITNQATDDELTWVVVAPPATTAVDTNSYFGVHINDDTNAMWRAQRLGAKWLRRFSVGRARWSEVELTEGVFTWPVFSDSTTFGITPMLNLGEDTPTWVSPLSNNTNYYSNFVWNAVVHYSNTISSFEIWNEPDQDQGEVPNMNHYTELLRIGSHAVKTACPKCQVVGGGGVATYTMVTNVWALLGTATNRVDVMSVHTYPPNEANGAALQAFTQTPIWNTESGTTDKGGYTFVNVPFRSAGTYVIGWKTVDTMYDTLVGNVSDQSRNLITTMGYGYKKSFYYDASQRNIEVYDFTSRQFSWLDYDDSIRAKGAALAGIYRLLDKSTGQGSLMFSNLPCYAFVSANFTPVVAVWANSNMTAVLSTDVNAEDLLVHDVMGNISTLPTRTLHFGRMPIMVENIGSVTLAQMCAGFSNAVVTPRADTTPPKLVLQSAKRHRQSDTFRAFAIDDSGVNDEDNIARLQYRYMVNGGAWSAWGGTASFEFVGAALPTVIWQTKDAAGNISSSEDVSGIVTNRTVIRAKIRGNMRIK